LDKKCRFSKNYHFFSFQAISKFEAMPFNMFFNRKLKDNQECVLKEFMEYIALNINEDKKSVVEDIWKSLGNKLRADERVKKIMSDTNKILNTRFSSKSVALEQRETLDEPKEMNPKDKEEIKNKLEEAKKAYREKGEMKKVEGGFEALAKMIGGSEGR
jgi:hypothetical protein